MDITFMGIGVFFIVLSGLGFAFPGFFLGIDRASRIWMNLVGEKGTLFIIRWISVPLLFCGGVYAIYLGYQGCTGYVCDNLKPVEEVQEWGEGN